MNNASGWSKWCGKVQIGVLNTICKSFTSITVIVKPALLTWMSAVLLHSSSAFDFQSRLVKDICSRSTKTVIVIPRVCNLTLVITKNRIGDWHNFWNTVSYVCYKRTKTIKTIWDRAFKNYFVVGLPHMYMKSTQKLFNRTHKDTIWLRKTVLVNHVKSICFQGLCN